MCTCAYQIYAPRINKTMYTSGFSIVVVSFLLAFSGNESMVGTIGSALSIGVMASPLAVLTTVIRSRSTSSLPFSSRYSSSIDTCGLSHLIYIVVPSCG